MTTTLSVRQTFWSSQTKILHLLNSNSLPSLARVTSIPLSVSESDYSRYLMEVDSYSICICHYVTSPNQGPFVL